MRYGIFLAHVTLLALLCDARAWATEGRTVGQFTVGATGAAQYSIPIWTPPGPRGIQPNLALIYSSQSGIGTMGVGWQIAGLGAITRCAKTYAQDTVPAAVALVLSDVYCLNGNRLRLTSGTYGAAGSTYQTEIANFSNVTATGTAGNGPSYFTVQGRDGLTYEYGYTDSNGNGANSQVLANGSSTADYWLLSKVIDRAGNNFVINYTSLPGTAVPNTILWTPTSEGATTYAYTMKFNYTTNVPQSSMTKYVGGTSVTNNQLLSSIAISNSGTVVKDYYLGYQASPTTGRDELISVKECADSGQSNCLSPTTVGYQSGAAGVSTTPVTALSGSSASLTARYDLNGDGYPDLIYNPTGNGVWYVAFGSATGYGAPMSTGITGYALFGNLTGGNKDGILAIISGTWWYYTWNGSFTGASTGIAYDSSTSGYQLADMNGDGLPDLIDLDLAKDPSGLKYIATLNARLNTSTGGTASFSSTVTVAFTTGGLDGAQLQTPDGQGGSLRRYDFDGDGRDDLVLNTVTGISPNFNVNTFELLSTGTGFTAETIASVSGGSYVPVFFTNWNDDTCTDFVSANTLYISGCNGTVPATYSVGTVVAAMDWDGDGRTDLVVINGTTLGVYLSTGGAPGTVLPTSVPYTSTCEYVTLDANGDGLDDLGCWSQTGSGALTYYLHNGAGQLPDLVSSIKDGYGNSVSPTYTSLVGAGNYAEYSDAAFPYQNYVGPLYVAMNATFSDPSNMPSGTYIQRYYYYGAWTNLQGRGFQGFYALGTVDSRTVLYENQYYERAFPYTGMKFQDIVGNSTFYVSQSAATPAVTTLDGTTNNERYFPYFSQVTTTKHEMGGAENGDLISTSVASYAYDNYGNATTVSTVVTDNDPGSPNPNPYVNDTWTSTTVNTITPNTSTWCLSLPTETQVTNSSTAPGGTAITRTVSFTPDYTNCRETQKVIEPSSSTYKVTDAYTYDGFGNLWTDTVTGVGMAARVTTLTWGTTGQFLTTAANPLSQVITLGYDPKSGVKTSQSDPNWTTTNPISTTWGYDPFFRKTSELRPDGTSTSWAYNGCGTGCVNSNNVMTVTKTMLNVGGTPQSVTNTYLDSVDRTLVSSSTMLNSAYNRNEVQYNSLGLVSQQGAPCTFVSCTNYWTTLTYDGLNRLSQSQRPISATNPTLQATAYGYAGRTTTITDALNNTTTKINLVTGALAQSKDAKGYNVNFTYDAFGARLAVTDSASPANTLSTATYKYGLKAFKTASTDMDLGVRSYTVDALGELTAYSDAKSQNFSLTYDALSRPTSRTEPDLTTTWVWGNTASSYNIGKLQSVTAVSSAGTYSESYGYDSKTRLSAHNETLPGDTEYAFAYTYNSTTGLLDTFQYPVSTSGYQLKLQYAYANGLLKSIADYNAPTTVFWTANATNPRGQVTQETLGNGVVTNRSYDAVTSWVNSIEAGPGGGSGLLNSEYEFDLIGDVTQRQDNNLGLTENFYYDTDYRLDHSMLNGSLNLQMVYDSTGMGNIASRSDVAGGAAWTYDSVRKHAVTQAGSSAYTYTYDPNGNAQTRNGYNVTWTSYNYPSGISSSGESTVFQYGPNRDRWQTIYTGSIGTETTYHVGKFLEKVINSGTTDYRHYIFVGNEAVAIYSRMSTGTNTLRYLLSDHLGSFASILSSTGTSVVNESFTAYGNRRSAETWSGAPLSGDETAINEVSREGYTGQTVLGVFMGLNHMNGRVEDAITGRFLSADPHGIDPSNTQSFNRYSYVQNRPLTLTDPTGFQVVKLVCNEFCSLPAGVSNFSPQLQHQFLSHLGFVRQVGANASPNTNSGDGELNGLSSSDSVDPPSDDTAALTAWFNAADAAIGDSLYNAAGGAPSSGDGSAQSQDPAQGQASSDGLQEITVVASRVYPVDNPGWDLVGLGGVQGIMSSGAQFLSHIRPRHASNAAYPQTPLNGRFAAPLLSMSTTPDQFDAELGVLFNGYTPAYIDPTPAGIALEFVLPGPVGLDYSNQPTNSWTVVLTPAGSGVFQVWTTYPGHPVPSD